MQTTKTSNAARGTSLAHTLADLLKVHGTCHDEQATRCDPIQPLSMQFAITVCDKCECRQCQIVPALHDHATAECHLSRLFWGKMRLTSTATKAAVCKSGSSGSKNDCLASGTWCGAQQALLDARDERIWLHHQSGGAAWPRVSSDRFSYCQIECVDIGIHGVALPWTAQLCVACT